MQLWHGQTITYLYLQFFPIDTDIVLRYRNSRCGILIGTTSDNNNTSLYAFCEQILGYDLAGFFKRHTTTIKTEIHDVLETLRSAE